MENSVAVPQKAKNKTTSWYNNSATMYICKGNEINRSKSCHSSHVYFSPIHNRRDAELTKLPSIHEWINKMWSE
jgi:hypothetical protein